MASPARTKLPASTTARSTPSPSREAISNRRGILFGILSMASMRGGRGPIVGWSELRGERQAKSETRATTRQVARDDRSTVRLGDLSGHVQAETHSAVVAG